MRDNHRNTIARLMTFATAGGLLALSGQAAAGLVDPGDPALFWTEAVNNSWHTPGNWSTGVVPGPGSTPVILNATANIFLNADTANLETLYLGHQRALSTNGHTLQVTDGIGAMVINGLDTNLFVPDAGGFAVNVDNIEIEDDGRLELSGGSVRVFSQLSTSSGGRVSGHGLLRANSPSPVAINLLNGGPLTVSGGDLSVQVFDGGSLVPPPDINVIQANRSLTVNAPLFLPVNNLTLGAGTSAEFIQPWSVDGQITGQAGTGNEAIIEDGGALTMDGTIAVTSGQLTIEPDVTLAINSAVNVGGGLFNDAILLLNGTTEVEAGQTTTLGFNSRLRIDGPVPNMWLGSIDSSAGTLEPNSSTGFWRINGDMNLGSFFGLRTVLDGSVITRAYGDVNITGLGAIINSPFSLQPNSDMEVVGANTQLTNNSELDVHTQVQVTGDGVFVNGETGILNIGTSSNVNIDIENAGTINAGNIAGLLGTAHVGADYTQLETGRMVVEIQGAIPSLHDFFEFSGTATLAGDIEIVLVAGFEPQVGDQFEVVLANAGVSGAFDAVTGAAGFAATYTPTTVVLEFVGVVTPPTCPGDLDGNGQVDTTDLGILLGAFGTSDAGDLNDDGITDTTDLGILLGSFGTTCEP